MDVGLFLSCLYVVDQALKLLDKWLNFLFEVVTLYNQDLYYLLETTLLFVESR